MGTVEVLDVSEMAARLRLRGFHSAALGPGLPKSGLAEMLALPRMCVVPGKFWAVESRRLKVAYLGAFLPY